MTARGNAMSQADRVRKNEEIDRLFERAVSAGKDEKIVTEFLKGFEKDYRAQIKQRKEDERK